jgi:flagellar biosynthesis GTPase FlhF
MSFSQPSSQCIDPADIDTFIDFNAMPSPSPASASRLTSSQIPSAMTSPTSTIVPLDMGDDHQTPVAPSHEYQRFKQQTGLPSGSMASLRSIGESSQSSSMFAGYNSGFDDFSMGNSMYDGMGSNSGLPDFGFDTEATSPLPAFFFPPGEGSQADDFVDPTAITRQEEAQANVRFYPGMHQQQAAMQKAQAQAQQQRQQQLIQQQQKQREEQARQSNRRSASHAPVDPRTEETIARVVNQIRQNSSMNGDSMSPGPHSLLPHVVRTKKDEDDMDEDERLLNSEEGKKLSSKERRQLRNKVSARAFRSRRKGKLG